MPRRTRPVGVLRLRVDFKEREDGKWQATLVHNTWGLSAAAIGDSVTTARAGIRVALELLTNRTAAELAEFEEFIHGWGSPG